MSSNIELNKISDNIWEIPKTGTMNVPGRIFASELLLEKIQNDRSLEQIKNMASLPGIYKYAIGLPDIHQGYGFSIGGVAALDAQEGGISPGGVGYDINCGVRLLQTDLYYENLSQLDVKNLIDNIFIKVPAGVGKGNANISNKQLDDILTNGSQWALENNFADKNDIQKTEDFGHLEGNPSKVSLEAKKRGRPQLGSLGSGNHFLELQKVDQVFDEHVGATFGLKEGRVTIMIHCGSRGLGHQVASDYLRIIDRKFKDIIDVLPDRQLMYAPAQSDEANDYLEAMRAAANYAFVNRQMIAYNTKEAILDLFPSANIEQVYDVCHNIAKLEKHSVDGEEKEVFVHRKGATRSIPKNHKLVPDVYKSVGQPVIIPGSMGTASYVLVGTQGALDLTFGSTAHGAGRVMSRTKALKSFSSEQIRKELHAHNVYIRSHSSKGIVEEAPQTYKDVDEVVEVSHQAGIGQKVSRLIPIGVLKG
jgi:tRNA-splicing ligase RtcB